MNLLPHESAAPLPSGIVPPEMWPEFGALAHPVTICARERVGTDPKGIRWSLWPITFEEYWSDNEPDLAESTKGSLARNRLVAWKRLHATDTPRGWRAFSQRPSRIDGYVRLEPGQDHARDWSKSALRNLKEWHTSTSAHGYTIEKIEFAEFKDAFLRGTSVRKTGREYIDVLERKRAMPECQGHYTLWGVRNPKHGGIIAGYVEWRSPAYKSSTREFPFILEEAKDCHASVGLMDHWMSRAKEEGVETLVTTHFWQPGEPHGWKGFSSFKSQFGYTYVAYPPTLWKFVPGKLF